MYIFMKIMEQYYSGTLRIKNKKTLQKWIDKGWYKEQIDLGWIFAAGCGRFRSEKCECAKCRKVNNGQALKDVLARNGF